MNSSGVHVLGVLSKEFGAKIIGLLPESLAILLKIFSKAKEPEVLHLMLN